MYSVDLNVSVSCNVLKFIRDNCFHGVSESGLSDSSMISIFLNGISMLDNYDSDLVDF